MDFMTISPAAEKHSRTYSLNSFTMITSRNFKLTYHYKNEFILLIAIPL